MNEDVEVIVRGSETFITFKRMFAVCFQMPPGITDSNKFIQDARPMAQQAFDKIVELSKPNTIKVEQTPATKEGR